MEDLKKAIYDAENATPDPVVEGLIKVARNQEKLAAQVKEARDEVAKVEEKTAKLVKNETEKLSVRLEETTKTVVDRIEAIEKRGIAAGVLTLAGGLDDKARILEAISPRRKHLVHEVERGMWAPYNVEVKDAVLAVAINEWFLLASRLQSNKFQATRNEDGKRFDALNKAFDEIARHNAAYEEGTDDHGGYGVPTIVASEILRLVLDSGLITPLVTKIPMGSDTLNIPTRGSNFTVHWVDEAGSLTGGEGTIGQAQLVAKKIVGRGTASSEVIEDSSYPFLAFVQSEIATMIGRELDQEIMEGDGTHFTGINAASGVNTISSGTNGGSVTYENLVKTMFAASETDTRNNAVWVMHPAIMGAVVAMTDDNGQPIFHWAQVKQAPGDMLLGRRIVTSSVLSRTQTQGTSSDCSTIYFGPFRYARLGVRRTLRWEVTDQVNWATDQLDFRMIGRFGFNAGVPEAFAKLTGVRV